MGSYKTVWRASWAQTDGRRAGGGENMVDVALLHIRAGGIRALWKELRALLLLQDHPGKIFDSNFATDFRVGACERVRS